MDYASLVLELLEEGKYPALEGYVVLDIYYKTIPEDYPSAVLKRYDRTLANPEDVYIRDMQPFGLNYLVAFHPHHFYMHRVDSLDTDPLPLQCITVKLARSYLDTAVLHSPSASFEEEIYRLLALLNCDVPRVAGVIDLDFIASTRFLPQRVQLWVFKYSVHEVVRFPLTEQERRCFGPTDHEVLPIRTVSGGLSQSSSRSVLLSLNNHHPFLDMKYIHHYTDKWKTVVPLAFNPLENPIITL